MNQEEHNSTQKAVSEIFKGRVSNSFSDSEIE